MVDHIMSILSFSSNADNVSSVGPLGLTIHIWVPCSVQLQLTLHTLPLHLTLVLPPQISFSLFCFFFVFFFNLWQYKCSILPYENTLFQQADVRGRPLDGCCHGDSKYRATIHVCVSQSQVWVDYFTSNPFRWNRKLRRWSTILWEVGVY